MDKAIDENGGGGVVRWNYYWWLIMSVAILAQAIVKEVGLSNRSQRRWPKKVEKMMTLRKQRQKRSPKCLRQWTDEEYLAPFLEMDAPELLAGYGAGLRRATYQFHLVEIGGSPCSAAVCKAQVQISGRWVWCSTGFLLGAQMLLF